MTTQMPEDKLDGYLKELQEQPYCLYPERPQFMKSILRKILNKEISQSYKAGEEAERKRIIDLIHMRKQIWHKDCLNDQFINGRFWEDQELFESLSPKENEG